MNITLNNLPNNNLNTTKGLKSPSPVDGLDNGASDPGIDSSKESSNESNDENDKNQVNQHCSLDKRPSKPPRKSCLNDANGYEQQNDNLVEEIYLAAEPAPVVTQTDHQQSTETKVTCNNLR